MERESVFQLREASPSGSVVTPAPQIHTGGRRGTTAMSFAGTRGLRFLRRNNNNNNNKKKKKKNNKNDSNNNNNNSIIIIMIITVTNKYYYCNYM